MNPRESIDSHKESLSDEDLGSKLTEYKHEIKDILLKHDNVSDLMAGYKSVVDKLIKLRDEKDLSSNGLKRVDNIIKYLKKKYLVYAIDSLKNKLRKELAISKTFSVKISTINAYIEHFKDLKTHFNNHDFKSGVTIIEKEIDYLNRQKEIFQSSHKEIGELKSEVESQIDDSKYLTQSNIEIVNKLNSLTSTIEKVSYLEERVLDVYRKRGLVSDKEKYVFDVYIKFLKDLILEIKTNEDKETVTERTVEVTTLDNNYDILMYEFLEYFYNTGSRLIPKIVASITSKVSKKDELKERYNLVHLILKEIKGYKKFEQKFKDLKASLSRQIKAHERFTAEREYIEFNILEKIKLGEETSDLTRGEQVKLDTIIIDPNLPYVYYVNSSFDQQYALAYKYDQDTKQLTLKSFNLISSGSATEHKADHTTPSTVFYLGETMTPNKSQIKVYHKGYGEKNVINENYYYKAYDIDFFNHETGKQKLGSRLMHTTYVNNERNLGTSKSHGCIRMPREFNRELTSLFIPALERAGQSKSYIDAFKSIKTKGWQDKVIKMPVYIEDGFGKGLRDIHYYLKIDEKRVEGESIQTQAKMYSKQLRLFLNHIDYLETQIKTLSNHNGHYSENNYRRKIDLAKEKVEYIKKKIQDIKSQLETGSDEYASN